MKYAGAGQLSWPLARRLVRVASSRNGRPIHKRKLSRRLSGACGSSRRRRRAYSAAATIITTSGGPITAVCPARNSSTRSGACTSDPSPEAAAPVCLPTCLSDTQSCRAFQTTTGIANSSATTVAVAHPPHALSSRRPRSPSIHRASSAIGSHRSIAYFARNPTPTTTPMSTHSARRRKAPPMQAPAAFGGCFSKTMQASRYVAKAQQKKNGGSMVIRTLPAMNIGTMWFSSTAPSASRSLSNSLLVSA